MGILRRVWSIGVLSVGCATLLTTVSSAQDVPITDGLLLWLDATDSSTLFQDDGLSIPALDGDPIGGWFDKSGNEFHAYQFDDIKRPDYDMAGMNGRPTVSFFSGDADGMFIDDGLEIFDRPYTAFIVNQYDGPVRGRTLQSRDINWLHGLWGGNPASYAEGWVSVNIPAEENFVYVADTVGLPNDSASFHLNGVDRTLQNVTTAAPQRLGLVSEGAFPGEVSDADVSEIIIYDRALSDVELASVRTYLYDKYDAAILPPPPPRDPNNTVLSGEVGAFTGGDPDDGLDFEGVFVYAVDVGGLGGTVVGDVEFTDGSIVGMDAGDSPGVSITVANEILAWHLPDYGDSANDDELEIAMQSIRWNVPPGLDVDLDVEDGTYQLQLLFAENCCTRGFDITVEDVLSVNNFQVESLQGGIANTSAGAFFRDTVVVTDGQLNIQLGGVNENAPDNNPILSAFTLELLGPAAELGDFNADGVLDDADIDALSEEVMLGTNSPEFDVNDDGQVNQQDRTIWVNELKKTYFGDANLDGEFSSTDFVVVFQTGEYEDDTDGNSGWADGDWSGDKDFNSSDFVVAFQSGGFELGPRGAVSSVPEPSAAVLLLLGSFASLATRRRKAR